MADPHVVLAPLVEPPLPPLPVSAPVAPSPLPGLVALVVILVLVALALGWWRRQAPHRALRRIGRLSDPLQAAQQLAQWQRRHARALTPQWQGDLDRLRFAAPDAQAAQTLQRLCAEAAEVLRAGKAG